jgi:hypothetical protein
MIKLSRRRKVGSRGLSDLPDRSIRLKTMPLTASFARPLEVCRPDSHSSSRPAPLSHWSNRSCELRDIGTVYFSDLPLVST